MTIRATSHFKSIISKTCRTEIILYVRYFLNSVGKTEYITPVMTIIEINGMCGIPYFRIADSFLIYSSKLESLTDVGRDIELSYARTTFEKYGFKDDTLKNIQLHLKNLKKYVN